MEQNEILHGFRLLYTQELPEIGARLHRMEYVKNGADLVWLERPDDNKTFSIAFKTIPQDDTGVFHILEHSVLNGSRKYPVKEPFVELLKSSLQTFLNAFTAPDMTMYPVCSRNDQDFLNLIDVYMDAVLHPLSVENPNAFRQEGWHYELDSPQGELRCNGVVYNEMKGAYADPDRVLMGQMERLLFPDNCYGCESGGHPEHIPELSYEQYLASHARFYHPSNARIFLDGQVNLDAVLGKLDNFLRDYDRLAVDADIPMQKPVHPETGSALYEISPEEAGENRVLLAQSWVYSRFDEPEKRLACAVLADVLCGSNEAPLKKALLEQGLAEDVELSPQDSMQQNYLLLVVRNTSQEQTQQVWQTVEDTLRGLAEQGLDHKQLHAAINHLEFVSREIDFGSFPRGLAYNMNVLESWLYGGDPAQNLCYGPIFHALRSGVEDGLFEKLLKECLLDDPHQARLCLLPSATLGEGKQQREQARLAAIRSGWTAEEAQAVIDQFHALRQAQQQPDSPEALASLPMLSLKDIPEEVGDIPQELHSLEGVTCLHQGVETDGIVYLDLYFSLADLPQDQLSTVSLLTRLLGQVATEHFGVMELRREINSNLGSLVLYPTVFAPDGHPEAAKPCLVVSASALAHKQEDVKRLVHEVLGSSRLDNDQFIRLLLRQIQISMEQGISASGSSYAAQRAGASLSAAGAVNEAFSGLTFLRRLQELNRDFDARFPALRQELQELCKHLFSRTRLTASVTGPWDPAWLSGLIRDLPELPMGDEQCYQPAPVRREGIAIAAEVGFAAKAGNLYTLGQSYSGSGLVAAQLLGLGYLWNTIRVKGGAYGTDMGLRSDGTLCLTSYRDPAPGSSLDSFDGAGEALRSFCQGGEGLDKYIISTVAATDPLMTPRTKGLMAAALYFTGKDHARRQKLLREILHTSRADLEAFSRVLDAVCGRAGVCVIGGRACLEACGEKLDSITPLQ